MNFVLKIVAFVLFLSFAPSEGFKGCSFRIHGHHEKNSPLIFSNSSTNFDFKLTRCGIVKLQHNESVIFTCPGEGNNLNINNTQSATVKCVKGRELLLNNRTIKYEDLECKRPITGDVQETKTECGNNSGRIINIGYNASMTSFITLIKVCYNNQTASTLYVEHTLHGDEIRHASKVTYKPQFSSKSIPKTINLTEIYKPIHQKIAVLRTFNFTSIAAKYINDKTYLAKTVLAPSYDFPFAAWKFTSYYNLNTAPQYLPIKNGNWKILENMIRKSANLYREKLNIITGTHGILKLKNEVGEFKEIFMGVNNKLPVPEYFYKIIYYELSRKAIVIVVSNNPFVREIKQEDAICESVCEKTGWVTKFWQNYSKGYVQCCGYQNFVKNVPTAPSIIVDGVLRGMYQI